MEEGREEGRRSDGLLNVATGRKEETRHPPTQSIDPGGLALAGPWRVCGRAGHDGGGGAAPGVSLPGKDGVEDDVCLEGALSGLAWPCATPPPHHRHRHLTDTPTSIHPHTHIQPGRRVGAGQGGSNGIKVGSFQEYVKHDFVVEDLSPSLLPVKEVRECDGCCGGGGGG